MTDRTFWDPKLPLSHRPIWDQNQEFRTVPPFRYHNQRETCQISYKMDNRFKSYETSLFLCPEKGQPPKRGTNWPQIEIFCFPGGDTLKSCVQSKCQAKRLKISRFMTDRTFWDPKLPHSHMPLFGQKLEIYTLSPFRHH